jgi:hypothetical protein
MCLSDLTIVIRRKGNKEQKSKRALSVDATEIYRKSEAGL